MYSLGCILHLIYTRKHFNNIETSSELLKNIDDNLKYLILDLLEIDINYDQPFMILIII